MKKETHNDKRRLKSFIKRSFGVLKVSNNETYNFEVISKINENPNSKGICSTSLFGDMNNIILYNRLVIPLIYNAKIINNILPGWCLRVYLSSNISPNIRNELIKNNCEIYIMNDDSNNKFVGTLWRFLCASESKPFIVCDADMRFDEKCVAYNSLNKKDVEKWLCSDKLFFRRKLGIINKFIPISAGMWGGKPDKNGNPPLPKIKEQMEKYEHNWFGTDESFLNKEVWPTFKKSNYTVSNNMDTGLSIIICVLIMIITIYLTSRVLYSK